MYNYKYHGKGRLYEKTKTYIDSKNNEYLLKYDGEFSEGIFNGYGKLYKKYYKDIYYEGNFINGEISNLIF